MKKDLKNNFYAYKLLVALICLPFLSFSQETQEMKISGNVMDTSMYLPIYNAKTFIVRLSDSLIVDYKTTDKEGRFEYNLPINDYRLVISFRDYDDKEFVFAGSDKNTIFELGEIPINLKGKYFEDIIVYAYKDPIYYRGDTLIYIADSFATKENAVVEDLLKRLPGIEVDEDGSIHSNGRKVDKVYVDGDEFFGSDPTVATKNLAAKSIDRVQVYEAENEDDPLSDEKLQILDLRLKDNAKTGWFAKANAASDFQHFHEGQLLFNRFREKQKMFAFGIGSNTLNSSLSANDASQLGMSSRGGGARGSSAGGYPLTFQAGAFFSQKVNDKFDFDGNYLFSDKRVTKETDKNIQYLLADTTYFSEANTQQNSKNQNHNLNFNFNVKIDSSQSLRITPRFSFSNSSNENITLNHYLDESRDSVRRASNSNSSSSESYNLGTNIRYQKNFGKPKRRLILSDNFSYNHNSGESHLLYDDYFFMTDLTDNEIRQLKDNLNANLTNTFTAQYIEPLSELWNLNLDYELFNNNNNRDQRSSDYDGSEYSILDSLTSNLFRTDKIQNRLGIAVNFNDRKHNFTLGARLRNILVTNTNFFTDAIIKQNETNVLPYLNYRYRISQNSSLTFRTNTNSGLPSIDYLAPTRDNSNPNAILEGNDNLKSSYNVSSNLSYMIFRPISGINFRIGANARYTFNDFARAVSYDSLGRSLSRYENINTFNSVSLNTGASFPILKRLITISPQFNYTNSNQNSIIDGLNNVTNTHNFMPSLKIGLISKYVEFSTQARLTEQIGVNSTNEKLNIRNTVWNWNNELKAFLPWKINVTTTGNYYNYDNLSQGYNKKFFILNASIEKRFGKYDSWGIGVEGYDLLNQNVQVNRTFNINTIEDTSNNIISRYFLFRVTYTFNSTFRIKND